MTERTMPPCGRERDALVAELVFGWVRAASKCQIDSAKWCWVSMEGPDIASEHRQLLPWSTDNHAALDALMAMQRQGYRFVIHWMNQPWTVSVWSPLFRSSMATGEELNGETFPDAVSAAIIRAKWAEQGDLP